MKNKIKACLVAILSFVMVFTSMPLVSHAVDAGGGDGVTGDTVFKIEWIFAKDDDNTPVLRMHLYGGGEHYYGRECRLDNGDVRSIWASHPDEPMDATGATLIEWLDSLMSNPQFFNVGWLRGSALDFVPSSVKFNQESDCYAAWTAEIENPPLGVTIEDAHTGQIAVEIDLESLQKKGGFDVYCSYNDDGIDGDELYQSKRYSDSTWDNTENRFIGLPDPGAEFHWELIWASYSDQNWGDYRIFGAPTAVAWTDPNNHIDIANNGMALGGNTGVSPCDEIRKKCGDDGVVYRLGFCRRKNEEPKHGTWGIWLDENGDGSYDENEKHMIDLDPDGQEKQLLQLVDNGEWELVSLYRDDQWRPYEKSSEYGETNQQLAAVRGHGTIPIQPNETVDLIEHMRLSDTINKLLSESDLNFGGEFYLGFKRKAVTKGTWGIWLDSNADGRYTPEEYHIIDKDPSKEEWEGFPVMGYGHETIEDEWELADIYTADTGKWVSFKESALYGPNKTPAEKMDNNLDIELIHPKDILDGTEDAVGPTDIICKYLQEYDGTTNNKFGGTIWFGFRRKVKVFKIIYDLDGGTGDSSEQSANVDEINFVKFNTHSAPTKDKSKFLYWEVMEDFDGGSTPFVETVKYTQGEHIDAGAEVKSKKPGILPLKAIYEQEPTKLPKYRAIRFFGDGATEASDDCDEWNVGDEIFYNDPLEFPADKGTGSFFDRILRSEFNINNPPGASGSSDTKDQQEAQFNHWYVVADKRALTKWERIKDISQPLKTYTEDFSGDEYTPWTKKINNSSNMEGSVAWVNWTFFDEEKIQKDMDDCINLHNNVVIPNAIERDQHNENAASLQAQADAIDPSTPADEYHSGSYTDKKGKTHYWSYTVSHAAERAAKAALKTSLYSQAAKERQEAARCQRNIDNANSQIEKLRADMERQKATSPYSENWDFRSRWKRDSMTTQFGGNNTVCSSRGIESPGTPIIPTLQGENLAGDITSYHQMGWYDSDANGSRVTGNKVSLTLGEGNSYNYEGKGYNTAPPTSTQKKRDPDTMLTPANAPGTAARVKGNESNPYEWYAHWYSVISYDLVSGLKDIFNGTRSYTVSLYSGEGQNKYGNTIRRTNPGIGGDTGITVTINDGKDLGYVGDKVGDAVDIIYNSDTCDKTLVRVPTVKYKDQSVEKTLIFVGWNTRADGSGAWIGTYNDDGSDGRFVFAGSDITLYAQYRIDYTLIYNGNRQTAGPDIGHFDDNLKISSGGDQLVSSMGQSGLVVNTKDTYSFRTNSSEVGEAYTNFERIELSELPYIDGDKSLKYRKKAITYTGGAVSLADVFGTTVDNLVSGFFIRRPEMKLNKSMQSFYGVGIEIPAENNQVTGKTYSHYWNGQIIPLYYGQVTDPTAYIEEEWNDNDEVWERIRHPYSWQGWSLDIGDPNNWDDDAYFNDYKVYHCMNPLRTNISKTMQVNPEGKKDIDLVSIYEYLVECLRYNPSDNIKVGRDKKISIITYAVWDQYPRIDSYYSVSIGEDDLEKGSLKTLIEERVKENVTVSDREDSDAVNVYNGSKYIPSGKRWTGDPAKDKALDVKIVGIDPDVLREFKGNGTSSITCTIQCIDSAGNVTTRDVEIWVNRDKEGDPKNPDGTSFIDKDGNLLYLAYKGDRLRQFDKEAYSITGMSNYLSSLRFRDVTKLGMSNTAQRSALVGSPFRVDSDVSIANTFGTDPLFINTEDKGGLKKDSIWRKNKQYKVILETALDNETDIKKSYILTREQRKNTADWINTYGWGNSIKSKDIWDKTEDPLMMWYGDSRFVTTKK